MGATSYERSQGCTTHSALERCMSSQSKDNHTQVMAHCLPTTIIFACESNSEVEDSWKRSEVALAIKDASREAYGLRPRRLNLP